MEISPLLLRPSIYSEEILPSYLARVAVSNFLRTTTKLQSLVIHHLQQCGLSQDHWARPRFKETYVILSELTKTPIYTLYHATGHEFATRVTPPGVDVPTGHLLEDWPVPMLLSPGILRDHLYTERRMQFCPECLRENGYVSREWMPILLTACTKHNGLFVSECDRCQTQVKIVDLIRGICPVCERRYGDMPSVKLAPESLGLRSQHWLRYWLGLSECVHPDDPLPHYPTRAIYSLVSGLRRCLLLVQPSEVLYRHPELRWEKDSLLGSKSLTVADNHVLTTTAVWITLNWPENFHRFLDAYTDARQLSRIRGPSHRLGILYSTYLEGQRYWQHPACAFVQRAFDTYLIHNSTKMSRMQNSRRYQDTEGLRDQFKTVGIGEAARILGVNQKKVRRFAREGRLPIIRTESGKAMLARQDVMELLERWENGFQGAERVAGFLGIPPITIRRLRQMDILSAEKVWDTYWLYDGDSVRALRTEVVERTQRLQALPEPSVAFKTAVFSVGRVGGGGIPGLLFLIRQGHMTPYHTAPETMRFDAMRFHAKEAQTMFAEWRAGNFIP
jgi:excisionase family DNA binding protein